MIAILLLFACPHPTTELPVTLRMDPEAVAKDFVRVEPGTWREPGGITLEIPPGWTGWAESRGSLLLSLEHRDTGSRLELWAFTASEEAPGPRNRPGCEVTFIDHSHLLPILIPATVASCEPNDPGALRVTGWYGQVGSREIHLELLIPPGKTLETYLAATPILESARLAPR